MYSHQLPNLRNQARILKAKGSPTSSIFRQSNKIGLHDLQAQVAHSVNRFNLLISGRRFGKTVLQLYKGIERVAKGAPFIAASPPVVLLAEPTAIMARRLLFKPLEYMLRGHPMIDSIDKTTMTFRFKRGKDNLYHPDIVITGANDQDGDRLRGFKLWHVGADEVQDWKSNIISEIVTPALADLKGTALLSGTPKGRANYTYPLYMEAVEGKLPQWAAFKFRSDQNPSLDPEELKRAALTMDPRTYRQEFQATFEDFKGQIYDHIKESHKMHFENMPTDFDNVILGMDWGGINPAAVIIGRIYDPVTRLNTYYLLDEWRNTTGQAVLESDFRRDCKQLCDIWSVTIGFADPSEPQSILAGKRDGLPIKEAENAIRNGIDCVNALFYHNRLFIASHLKELFSEFQSYHRKVKDGYILEDVADGQPDHCLVAGTLVSTSKGEVKIEDVEEGDLVLTREGFKPVLWSGMTCESADIYRLTLSDGTILEGTYYHPILSNNEWYPLGELRYNQEVEVINKSKWKLLSLTASFIDVIQNLSDQVTEITTDLRVNLLNRVIPISIRKFGRMLTDQFLKGIISTIKITIHLIMNCQILSVFRQKNTQLNTEKSVKQGDLPIFTTSEKQSQQPQNGIDQMKVENGTDSMVKTAKQKENLPNINVNIAVMNTQLKTRAEIDFAQTNAEQDIGANQELTTKSAFVQFVKILTRLIGIQKQKPVVVSVEVLSKAKVFNLHVKDCHEFYANGVLVHNCLDATRYALFSWEFAPRDFEVELGEDYEIYEQMKGFQRF